MGATTDIYGEINRHEILRMHIRRLSVAVRDMGSAYGVSTPERLMIAEWFDGVAEDIKFATANLREWSKDDVIVAHTSELF